MGQISNISDFKYWKKIDGNPHIFCLIYQRLTRRLIISIILVSLHSSYCSACVQWFFLQFLSLPLIFFRGIICSDWICIFDFFNAHLNFLSIHGKKKFYKLVDLGIQHFLLVSDNDNDQLRPWFNTVMSPQSLHTRTWPICHIGLQNI